MQGGFIFLRDYKRAALALMGLSVIALYGAAIAYPVDRPERADRDWTALQQVAPEAALVSAEKLDDSMVAVSSVAELRQTLAAIAFELKPVRRGNARVPRLFVESLPEDFDSRMVVEQRKKAFIRTMLPLILRVNEELRQSRARIAELNERVAEGGVLSAAENRWIAAQYDRHDVKPGNIALLLRRVDVIPPSLALAQAAEESGWGTSRFAQEGRALFGQRTHAQGIGIVPAAHAEEAGIKVKSFGELLDGVRSYARNLNTHNAYADFRKMRARMREQARDMSALNSMRLIETLQSYSERGSDYVDTIKTIIRVNSLRRLDGAKLSENVSVKVTRLGA